MQDRKIDILRPSSSLPPPFEHTRKAIVGLSFSLFFVFLCGAQNYWDWDLHRAYMEVDLRSWLIDLEPPLWSYQMCGGVTRIGDPESFGLSPLFLFIIVFGNLWGAILLVLTSAFVGYSYLWRMLLLLSNITQNTPGAEGSASLAKTFSLFFVFGNYFLCRFLLGHPTYILIYIGIGIIFYTIKALLLDLQRNEFIVAVFLVWCFFSAGFYHAFIFFMLPIFLTLTLSLAWNLSRQMAQKETSLAISAKALAICVGFHITGFILASYKVIGIWRYQQSNPRTVLAPNEKLSDLFELLGLQLAPLYQGKLFGAYESQGLWNIWETSHFNLVHWAFLVLFIALGARWVKHRNTGIDAAPRLKTMLLLFSFLACIGALFLAGNIPYGPHALLNHFLDGSVRVTPRYAITLTFALCGITYLLIQRIFPTSTTGFQKGLLFSNLLVLLNMSLFIPNLNFKNFSESSSTPHHVSKQIDSLVIHPEGHRVKPLVAGQGILNCFSPLNRKQMIVGNITWNAEEKGAAPPPVILPFIHQKTNQSPDTCFLESYFTQNQIRLHPSCPPGTCVNLNGLSPVDAENFVLDSNLSRYCTK